MTVIYDPACGHIADVMDQAIRIAAVAGEPCILKFNGKEYEVQPSHYRQMMVIYNERHADSASESPK